MLRRRSFSIATRIMGSFGFVIAVLAGQRATGFRVAGHSKALRDTPVAEPRTKEDLAVASQSAMLQQQFPTREIGVLIDMGELGSLAERIPALDFQIDGYIKRPVQSEGQRAESAR